MTEIPKFIPVHYEQSTSHDLRRTDASPENPLIPWNIHDCLTNNERFHYRRLTDIYNYFQEEISSEELNRITILVVGSDGRMENAPDSITFSPIEFCLLTEADTYTYPILTAINKGIRSRRLQSVQTSVEIKFLQNNPKDYVLSGYRGNPRHAWPDRILDAIYLLGNEEYISTAYNNVFNEWNSNRKIRDCIKDNHKQYSLTTLTGVRRNSQHFDTMTGEIFFDPIDHVRGLKYGPIRQMQTLLTIRQLVLGGSDGVLPNSTYRKLQMLYPEKDDVIEAYQKALVLYHQQQSNRFHGETGYIIIDPDILHHICSTISSFDKEEYSNLMKIWEERKKQNYR